MYYSYEMNSNYLQHYGVKGMKWGVRRNRTTYEERNRNAQNKHISKIETSKTSLGKDYHNKKAYESQVRADIANNWKSSKGIVRKVQSVSGRNYNATTQKAASNYYDRKADYSKTNLGKTYNKSVAYNLNSSALANEKLSAAKKKGVVEYGKTYIDQSLNRPVKSWSGRETTSGKLYVETMLGIGTVKDVAYYVKNRKNS